MPLSSEAEKVVPQYQNRNPSTTTHSPPLYFCILSKILFLYAFAAFAILESAVALPTVGKREYSANITKNNCLHSYKVPRLHAQSSSSQ
jgi:hypothetical protein